jgi:ABC-type sugar transport system permease subunit
MKLFVKKYVFSEGQRLFWAAFLSIFLLFFLLFVHLWITSNSLENFKTEIKITALMNTSKLIYDKYGDATTNETGTKSQTKKGKSWLSFYEEESSGFDLLLQSKPKGKETAKEKEENPKFKDFSYILGYIVTNYGLPADENELLTKDLWNIEVIKGEKLIASSDIESLDKGKISIKNLFRIKKDSTENNFVIEERNRGFFVGYDEVIKGYTFKDEDLTVGVGYIEKPLVFPYTPLIFYFILSLILALIFIPIKFLPEKIKLYVGIALLLVVALILYSSYSNYLNYTVYSKAEEVKPLISDLFKLLQEKGLVNSKEEFVQYLSKEVGDIKAISYTSTDGTFDIEPSSLKYYQNLFLTPFTLIYLIAFLLSLGVFYYSAKGGLEKWLNAFYNYSVVYIFIIIALLLVFILIGVPFLFTIIMSFTSLSRYLSDLNLARQFVGLYNYQDILNIHHILAMIGFEKSKEIVESSPFFVRNFTNFYQVLINTFLYTFFSVIIQVTLGVLFAVTLNDNRVKLRGIYQVLLILPWVIPTYISALLWREALGQYGAFKQLFDSIGLEGFNIYVNSTVYFLSICFVSAWYAFPFIMIVTLSGLQGISESVKDAALIDGAGWFTRLFSIYLPLIRPTLLPSVLLSSIWTFNNFNIVYLYTGGNDAYDILITRIYDFVSRPDLRVFTYGYAAAYSTLVFIILLIYILAFARITKLTERTY